MSLENTTVSLSAKVQKHHAGITLLGGRPNIAGVIRGITARHQDELEVCVAAAGAWAARQLPIRLLGSASYLSWALPPPEYCGFWAPAQWHTRLLT